MQNFVLILLRILDEVYKGILYLLNAEILELL